MNHAGLLVIAARWLRQRGCNIVLTEAGRAGEERPDAIGWEPAGMSTVVEAKTTRKDFLAEWSRIDRKEHRRARGMGIRRFYLAPSGIIKPEELTENGWGLIEVFTGGCLEKKPSEPFDANRDAELRLLVANYARIRNKDDKQQQFQW
jgi:hypothetical protein